MTDGSNTDWKALEMRIVAQYTEGLEKQRDVLERRCALQLGTIRELRETVEHLKQVTSEHAREVNRLTGANTELAEAFTEAERERDELKADLAHAIEVKNRCVAAINKLCSQAVELQAQLKGKE